MLKILGGASIKDIVDDAASQLSPESTPNLGQSNGSRPEITAQDQARRVPKYQSSSKKDTMKAMPETVKQKIQLPISSSSGKDTNGQPADKHANSRPTTNGNGANVGLHTFINGQETTANVEEHAEIIKETVVKNRVSQSTTQRSGPLSHGQLMFWIVDLLTQDPTTLNHTSLYRTKGTVRTSDLERAVIKVAARHEILRTCFQVDMKDRPIQKVLQQPRVQLEMEFLEEEHEISRVVKEMQSCVFDLENGQALRLILVKTPVPEVNFLVCGCHHIIIDGASSLVLMMDLEKAYRQESLGPPPLQYLDFSALEKKQENQGAWNKSLGYWKSTFDGPIQPIPILPLPDAASTRSKLSTYKFHRVAASLTRQLTQKIDVESRKLQATPFQFYLSAFRTLLARFIDMRQYVENDTEDSRGFSVGIASNNRTDENSNSIGPFVNLLPLHFPTLGAGTTFADLLQDTRSRTLEAMEHSVVPFGAVLELLQVPRSTDHSPLFQTFVDYREGAARTSQFAGLQLELLEFQTGKTAYDVNLDIIKTPNGCRLEVMVQSSLYSERDAKIFLDCYQSVLTEFSAHADQDVYQPSIFPSERVAAAVELGKGPIIESDWGAATLVHRVRDIINTFAADEAVRDGHGKTFTYAQLWRRAVSIAEYLEATLHLGDQEEPQMIAVLQDRTAEWICSVLAIWITGHIYVPMDNSLPTERLRQITSDCKPALVIFDADNAEKATALCPEGQSQAFSVFNISTTPSTEDNEDESHILEDTEIHATGEDPAVVFYTSGSTGTAKGILISHSSLVNEVEFSAQTYGIGTGERVLQQSNLGFDMSLTQIFAALAFGGRVFVCPRSVLGSPLEISRIIATERITITGGTPSEYVSWLTDGSFEVLANLKSSPWRVAISGGEPVTPSLVKAVRTLGAGRPLGQNYLQLFNAYGPTEVTCSSSRSLVNYGDAGIQCPVPAGRTAPNALVTIVDRRLNPLPVGFKGEIVVGGAGVAIGYLGLPEETEQSFVVDESTTNTARMHRTADVGRLLADGRLVVDGRISGDTQVKLRGGIRVDLREIEHAIMDVSQGYVVEAVASIRATSEASRTWTDFVVAHVVFSNDMAEQDEQPRVEGIQEALSSVLPRRAVPSLIIPVDKLPRGETGKTDRGAIRQLPLLVCNGNLTAHILSDEAPRDTILLTSDEEKLGAVWQTILPREVIGGQHITMTSDFFRLGGSSLMLPELQRRIDEEFGVRLSLGDMFGASSLSEMVALVRGSHPAGDCQIDWTCEIEGLVKELREEAVAAQSDPSQPPRSLPEVVVLTGATGQLGARLLQLLIEHDTISIVHCIAVRQPEKLPDHHKIRVHRGDLGQPLLGLSAVQAKSIFQEADVIIHNGAVVSHLKSYHSLRSENVLSTAVLARLALPRRIPIHYISSAGVSLYYSAGHEQEKPVDEWDKLVFGPVSVAGYPPHSDGVDGYTASKWASERVLEELGETYASACHASAARVLIHRPSHILRSWDLGTRNGDNVLENMLYLCKIMRRAPKSLKIKGFMNIVDLQGCAESIMEIVLPSAARLDEVFGDWKPVRYFHHLGDRNIPLHDLKGYVEQDGEGSVELVAVKDWTEVAETSGLGAEHSSYLKAVDEGKRTYMYPILARE